MVQGPPAPEQNQLNGIVPQRPREEPLIPDNDANSRRKIKNRVRKFI